jgi:hypothetical protein
MNALLHAAACSKRSASPSTRHRTPSGMRERTSCACSLLDTVPLIEFEEPWRRGRVMQECRILAQGPAVDLIARPGIQRAYLGLESL